MAKTGSFIKIDRGLKNNPLWLLEKPFTKGQAWVDLLMLAQGVDKSREYHGKKQKIKRGCVYTSIYFLAKRWGWSRMKVYRYLERLMIDEMIDVQGWKIDETTNRTVHSTTNETANETTGETTISIVNWAFYQYSETTDETASRPVRRTRDETTNETHKRKIRERYTEKEREYPPKSPQGGTSPSGGNQAGGEGEKYDNNHADTMMPREQGRFEDIPVKFRDGTYQSFKTYAEYWDWSNQ